MRLNLNTHLRFSIKCVSIVNVCEMQINYSSCPSLEQKSNLVTQKSHEKETFVQIN